MASDEDKAKELIDNSSFGSEGAKALSNRTPPEVVEEILHKLKESEGAK